MKNKILIISLLVLLIGSVAFSVYQYHEKQQAKEELGNAIYLISNNENYQLEKLLKVVKNGNSEMAINQIDQLVSLMDYEIIPGGSFPWVKYYKTIDQNIKVAFLKDSSSTYPKEVISNAKKMAIKQIELLISTKKQIDKLCQPAKSTSISPDDYLSQVKQRYFDLANKGSQIFTEAEKITNASFNN